MPTALATKMMQRDMEKLDIPPIPEFIEMIGEFYELAAGGEITFT